MKPGLPQTAATALLSFSKPYISPSWASSLKTPPHGRLSLAHLPTPLYLIATSPSSSSSNSDLMTFLARHKIDLWIKRDDCTGGIELSGNKIRKLEFLLADALAKGCTDVITIGGEQSNHCRATAAAARMVGLNPHLILRSRRADDKNDLGTVGNLLQDRLAGSSIYSCTAGEYGRIGSEALVERLRRRLESRTPSSKVYPIPVGGSNAVGTWGYLNAVDEIIQQTGDDLPEHIVFACGSGGTAAGIVLGFALAYEYGTIPSFPQLHAVGVCDDPDYFYSYMANIVTEMGFAPTGGITAEDYLRRHVTLHQGKGRGYAVNTKEELEFVVEFARTTGISLDPVYSGKALHHFWREVLDKDPALFANQSILFWHTGGALGLYDKIDELLESTTIMSGSPCQRLDVYGRGNGVDISE